MLAKGGQLDRQVFKIIEMLIHIDERRLIVPLV